MTDHKSDQRPSPDPVKPFLITVSIATLLFSSVLVGTLAIDQYTTLDKVSTYTLAIGLGAMATLLLVRIHFTLNSIYATIRSDRQ